MGTWRDQQPGETSTGSRSGGRRCAASAGDAHRRGFTLVELLVVIVIIVILAGLLLPAIGIVKSQAREVDCMSRMRQLGMCFTSYLSDTDGVFPLAASGGNWSAWYTAITNTLPAAGGYGLSSYRQSGAAEWGKLLFCSEDQNGPTTDVTPYGAPAGRIAWDMFAVSHGYNAQGLGASALFTPAAYANPARVGEIGQKTDTVLVIDTMDTFRPAYGAAGFGHALAAANNSMSAYPRHRGGRLAMVLWVDGHVSGVMAAAPGDYVSLYSTARLGLNNGSNANPSSPSYVETCWDRQ